MTYTIVVLAGGKSSRFGMNKPLFKIGTKTMLEWVLDAATGSQASEIILSVKSADLSLPKNVDGRIKVVKDEIAEYSPLVGIMSAARASTNPKTIVTPADSPLITSNFFNSLYTYLEKINVDGIVPIWNNGKIEAIHAAYRTDLILDACEQLIKSNNYEVKYIPKLVKKIYFLPITYFEKRDRLSLIDFDSPNEFLGNFYTELTSPLSDGP